MENPEKKGKETYSVSSSDASRTKTLSSNIPNLSSYKHKIRLRNSRSALTLVIMLLVGLVGGYGGAWLQIHNSDGSITTADLSHQKRIVSSESQLINQIAMAVGPSVVSINVNVTSSSSSSSSGGGFGLFGFQQPEQEQAAGTGIILTSDGLVITNRHVVPDGTTNVSVTLSDGTELKDVSVLGRTNSQDSLDIAFLKINNTEGHKLTPAVIGDSSQVQVGDAVVAIGNALGQFQNTVTSGIISGYGRDVQAGSGTTGASENLVDLFQTDAAINEGNSGGPLVNLNGDVIGINTAIAGNAQNIGFAIPINDAKGLIDQVVKTGRFATPYLGVRYIPLTADVASEFNLNVMNGAFIAPASDPSNPSIVPGSPADKAGLRTGDIVTAVNGTPVDQTHSLTGLLDLYQPGTNIKLTVLRNNSSISLKATLGSEASQ